ncbi:hypothetical protein [Micromonospora sp. NPDC000442]|uniref:hypothetical protein n=1 Tax=Micromonospora sp. NPDC000442 TaxID=3364217 RepID=UPI00367D115E
MNAPFMSLAQILNRLAITARRTLRDHHPTPNGTCPICRVPPDCPAATAARSILDTISQMRWRDRGDPGRQTTSRR